MTQPVSPETTLLVILGASEWPDADLEGSSAFADSAHDLMEFFLDSKGFGLPARNLLNLFDQLQAPSELLVQVGDFLEERLSQGNYWDLVLYYVGHGFFTGNNDDFYLALKGTKAKYKNDTSLRVRNLANRINENGRHLRRYVLFDCCFAAAALPVFQSALGDVALRKAAQAFPAKGTLLYCSSSRDNASRAPKDFRYTMFSGCLLQALREGHASLSEKLSLEDVDQLVMKNLKKVFREGAWVKPELHSPKQEFGDLRHLPLFPNPARHRDVPTVPHAVALAKLTVSSSFASSLYLNGKQQADLHADVPYTVGFLAPGVYRIVLQVEGNRIEDELVELKSGQHLLRNYNPKLLPSQSTMLRMNSPIVQKVEKPKERKTQTLKAGDLKSFREGGVEITMAWCPSGSFLMGSPESERQRQLDEIQHRVTLTQGFWLGRTEVTQALWKSVMFINPSNFKGDTLPVDSVSWNYATEFIKRLNAKVGKEVYRLPTEAEWEYACRAGTTTPFNTGGNLTTNMANFNGLNPYADFPKGEYRRKTSPAGHFPCNSWGLQDMHGNLWEWCQDWLGNYEDGDQVNPCGFISGKYRVLRGGSWGSDGSGCRSAYRLGGSVGFRYCGIGFRLARGQKEPEAGNR